MMKIRWMTVLLFSIAALLLVACGGSSASTEAGGAAESEPVEVQVTLKEMSIQSSLTSFAPGVPYRFVVSNQGALNHEFMIMPVLRDKAAGKAASMDMEEMDKMALAVIEEDDLVPGTTQTINVTFADSAPAGQLELACHVPGHYEGGMHVPIVVK